MELVLLLTQHLVEIVVADHRAIISTDVKYVKTFSISYLNLFSFLPLPWASNVWGFPLSPFFSDLGIMFSCFSFQLISLDHDGLLESLFPL